MSNEMMKREMQESSTGRGAGASEPLRSKG